MVHAPAQSTLPDSPFNETHWEDEEFQDLIAEATVTVDEPARCEMLRRAQQIEYERGGYIIWEFNNQVDAHSTGDRSPVGSHRHPIGQRPVPHSPVRLRP